MLGTKRKFEELANGSDNDNSKKQKTDDLDNIQKHKEIQSKTDEIKVNFYESAQLNEYCQTYQQIENEIQVLQLKKDNFVSTLISFINSLSVMEKYYFLQENKIARKLYFDNNTKTNGMEFFIGVALYKYLEEKIKIKNPILLSWMDLIEISRECEGSDYHEESSTRISMGPFFIFFSFCGNDEGEGTYTLSICSEDDIEVSNYCDVDYEEFEEDLQSFYDEHCDAKEISFSELVDFCSSIVVYEGTHQYQMISWNTYSRNKNQQKSARK